MSGASAVPRHVRRVAIWDCPACKRLAPADAYVAHLAFLRDALADEATYGEPAAPHEPLLFASAARDYLPALRESKRTPVQCADGPAAGRWVEVHPELGEVTVPLEEPLSPATGPHDRLAPAVRRATYRLGLSPERIPVLKHVRTAG